MTTTVLVLLKEIYIKRHEKKNLVAVTSNILHIYFKIVIKLNITFFSKTEKTESQFKIESAVTILK